MHKPKAIFFDLDETLIKNYIPARKLFGLLYFDFIDDIGEENKYVFFETLQKHAVGLWNGMFNVATSPEQQIINCIVKALAATGAVAPQKTAGLAKHMFDHVMHVGSSKIELHDGAIETLDALRSQGLHVSLITNGIERLQRGKVYHLGLQNHLDHINISVEAQAHKPLEPIFNLALSRAGVKPENAWHVGDHITNDVAGAIRVGMSGVFYDPSKRNVERSFADIIERPNYTIHRLPEILDLI